MDVVALVSVVSSGLVGIGGVWATMTSSARQFRWQGREERATELRSRLDSAGEELATAMRSFAEAHSNIISARLVAGAEAKGRIVKEAADGLSDGWDAMNKLWTLANRVKIRRGAESAVAQTLEAAMQAVGQVGTTVRAEVGKVTTLDDYGRLWQAALDAERAFYDSSAAELDVADQPRRRRLASRTSEHDPTGRHS